MLPRLRSCGRRRIDTDAGVMIKKRDGVAHYTNVQMCGGVHSCPVCGPKIRQRRAEEIEAALRVHLTVPLSWGDGKRCRLGEDFPAVGSALFLTFTLPHDCGDDLTHLLATVADGFRRVIGGRGYLADKATYGIVGSIRALDLTHGAAGWHPHLHVLLFLNRAITGSELRTLQRRFFDRWESAAIQCGYRAPLIGLCPVERVTTAEVGNYVQKVVLSEETGRRLGMELTRHDLKQGRRAGRAPFQILSDFAASGDCADLALWHEWETVSRGSQSLTWSRGLKSIFAVAEKSDEEIAAEEIGGEDVTMLSEAEWGVVVSECGQLAILEAAEREGESGVHFWLFSASIQRHLRSRN